MASEGTSCLSEKERARQLDTILGFGNYQWFQVWVLQTLIAIIGAINYYHVVFLVSDPPEWGCRDEDAEKCNTSPNMTEANDICGGGEVIFNTSHQNYIYSLSVEHQWLCSSKVRGPWVISATYVGTIINSLTFGQLVDKWGRKPIFHITNFTFLLCRLVSFHVTDHYWAFLILTALGTSFFPVGVRAGYTIIAELCDDRARKYAFISGWVWWVIGLAILPFLAKWTANWYLLGLATTLCNLILVAIYPFLPESPRWLLAQGRHAEAAAIITNMRRINKDEELPNLEERLRELMPVRETGSTERATLTAFVRRASLFRVGLSLATIWCVNDYFYIAGSMNVENLAGDMFVNFSLLSLTELPSVFIGQFLIDRFGRRWVHLCCMAITTLAFAVICLLAGDKSLGLAVIVLSILSKFASNVGWFIMWVQCVEVFPTPLRGTGMNLCVMISTVVSMTGPFVVDLGSTDLRYPFLIFTGLGVIGIFMTSLVPETKDVPLPERNEDVDKMVKNFRYFEFRPWLREERNSGEEQIGLKRKE